MFITLIALALISPLIRATATLEPGVYHLVNLGHPYAPASFNSKNRSRHLPLPTKRQASQSKILAARSMRGSPLLLRVNLCPLGTGSHPTAFHTVLSGTADFPGDDTSIPDRYLDYWTIGIPGGLVWTYNSSAGPEERLFPLTFETLLILHQRQVSPRPLSAARNAGQYWMFAAQGSLPFLPRDLNLNDTRNAFLSPHLVFSS